MLEYKPSCIDIQLPPGRAPVWPSFGAVSMSLEERVLRIAISMFPGLWPLTGPSTTPIRRGRGPRGSRAWSLVSVLTEHGTRLPRKAAAPSQQPLCTLISTSL